MSISVNKAFIKKNKLLKELALKITITKSIVQQSCQGITNTSECRLIRSTIEGKWMKCYNFGRNVTILLLDSIHIYVYYI